MIRNVLCCLCVMGLLSACAAPAPSTKPAITVIAPPDGTRYLLGESIALSVATASSNDVARVELRVGAAVLTQQNNPPGPTFSTRFVYTPTQTGAYTFTLVAIDRNGGQSDPLVWTGIVADHITVLSTPTAIPPIAPPPLDACRLDSAFVGDVTIPDGTAVRANTPFTKTWRIRNTSDCAWGAGYQLVFVDRAQMGALDAVPAGQSARGATLDVSVRFVAPQQRGVYTSTWQMRSPSGTLFGTRLFVQVRVP